MSEAVSDQSESTPIEVPPIREYVPEDVASLPMDETFNVAKPEVFQADAILPYFERLRNEDPVHYCADSDYGSYWSITKYDDILQVDKDHETFSSEGGITIATGADDFRLPMFIAMDPPKHDAQRKVVQPVVAPRNLAAMESTIRQRAGDILDSLPKGETFDWVDRVSIEQTTQMLATLFDFPWEDRRKLTRWSDVGHLGARYSGGLRGSAPRGAARVPRLLRRAVERTGEQGARQRPHLDARTWRVDQEHGAHGVPGQPRAADRGRQRHHAQYDFGQRPGPERKSTAVRKAEGGSVAGFPTWSARPFAGRRRWRTCAAWRRATLLWVARPSKRATRSSCGTCPATAIRTSSRRPTSTASIVTMRDSTFPLASACIAAWATAWRSCSCASSGKKFLKRFDRIEVVGEPERNYSTFVRGFTKLPVRIV